MRVRRIRDTFNYPGFAGRTSVEVDNYNYTTEDMQVFDWQCLQNAQINSCQDYACQCYENLWYQFTAQIEEDYFEGSYRYDKECPNAEMPRVPLFGEKRCCGHCQARNSLEITTCFWLIQHVQNPKIPKNPQNFKDFV